MELDSKVQQSVVLTCTDSSSDNESIDSDISIESSLGDGQTAPLHITVNQEYPSVVNEVFLEQGFRTVNTPPQKRLVYKSNTIISDKEYDESIPSSIYSVSPSDEEAYRQELNGDVTDYSSEHGSISNRPMLDVEMNSKNSSQFPMAEPENGKAVTLDPDETSVSKEFALLLNTELITRMDEQKAKSIKDFLDWKIELPKYFVNGYNLLSQVFKLHFDSLEGEYWFGSDFIINCNQQQVPLGHAFIGLILSEGSPGKKYLVVNGRKRVELHLGYSESITDFITIKVHDNGMLAMYNKTKPSYQVVSAGPPDLFYDYNPKMVFLGLITVNQTFKVNILGCDVEFNLDVFGNECQVLYIDQLSRLQKIYPVRVVVLKVLSERLALIDFNYSYASGLYPSSKYEPKFIDLLIPAGVNPLYF